MHEMLKCFHNYLFKHSIMTFEEYYKKKSKGGQGHGTVLASVLINSEWEVLLFVSKQSYSWVWSRVLTEPLLCEYTSILHVVSSGMYMHSALAKLCPKN